MLYCLLYGCTPFQHIKNYGQKAASITNPNHRISFPERSQILPGDGVIPQGLLNTVQLCLSYQPQDRPSTKDLLEIKYCGCNQQNQSLGIQNHGNVLTLVLTLFWFSRPPCSGVGESGQAAPRRIRFGSAPHCCSPEEWSLKPVTKASSQPTGAKHYY
jgi:serine/threonine protein kinase